MVGDRNPKKATFTFHQLTTGNLLLQLAAPIIDKFEFHFAVGLAFSRG